MKIEIITIGNELLYGHTINTNAAFISECLSKEGYFVNYHVTIADDAAEMKKMIKAALNHCDLVITTGGLGPTLDDNTKSVACSLFHCSLEHSDEIFADLKKRFFDLPSLDEQSMVPHNAVVIPNEIGTAPGLIFKNNATLILLPGVPQEMKPMFSSQILSYIKKHFPLKKKLFQKYVNLCLLHETKVDPIIREISLDDQEVNIGIYPSYGFLRVCFSLWSVSEEDANNRLTIARDKLLEKFPQNIFSLKDESIDEVVKQLCLDNQKTLSIAESCTGGALSSRITLLPGASAYFIGSIVAYSNEIKRNVLHVPKEVIDIHGVVSPETVTEMVKGCLDVMNTDYAIAISGIAGPGGATEGKPIGTVCMAIGEKNGSIDAGMIHALGNRQTVIEFTTNFALAILWRLLKHQLPYFNHD